jgi:quercetin dioxygenase-like cupin family protein
LTPIAQSQAIERESSTLRRLLADVFALYVKTTNFHWHISGRPFRDYHLLLDEQSTQMFAVPRAKNERSIMLRKKIIMVVLISLIAGPLMAQEGKVTSLITKDLTEFSGKEGLMITVEYAPGGSDSVHRHDAHAFVYVLEGSIVMQVKGGEEVTLTPGQTFYEGPNDVHVVSRNASSTKPAKFLVFFVKDKGAPVLVPVK